MLFIISPILTPALYAGDEIPFDVSKLLTSTTITPSVISFIPKGVPQGIKTGSFTSHIFTVFMGIIPNNLSSAMLLSFIVFLSVHTFPVQYSVSIILYN